MTAPAAFDALAVAGPLGPRPPRVSMQILEIEWRPERPLRLAPFPASTLRGAIGRALRPLVCITGESTCDGCLHLPHCAYGYIFEGTLPPGAPKRLHTPARPYVVDLPFRDGPTEVPAGGTWSCRLALFGSARAFVPALVVALQHAGARGLGDRRVPMRLIRVERVDAGDRRALLYDEADGIRPASPGPPIRVEPVPGPAPARVRLVIDTPLDLRADGRLLERFDPIVFTARLSERLDVLSAAHEGVRARWDFQLLRTLAGAATVVGEDLRRVRWQRRSGRQGRAVEMDGIVGAVELEGVHPDVLALWRCAADVRVGKKAAFGFGRVRVEDG